MENNIFEVSDIESGCNSCEYGSYSSCQNGC